MSNDTRQQGFLQNWGGQRQIENDGLKRIREMNEFCPIYWARKCSTMKGMKNMKNKKLHALHDLHG
jgi:hypothetical protein